MKKLAWLLAFAPIISIVTQLFLRPKWPYGFLDVDRVRIWSLMTDDIQNHHDFLGNSSLIYNYDHWSMHYWYIPLILHLWLAYYDESCLRLAGVDTKKFNTPGPWLIPVYLYERSRALKQSQTLLVVWLFSFMFSLLMLWAG